MAPHPSAPSRYSLVAIFLHWGIAILILGQIGAGLWMVEAIHESKTRDLAFSVFQLHKSAGLTVLALSIVRLGWRLGHAAPPLPAGMKPWEKFAATAVHVAFYALMFAMPLSGWAYVSTGWSESFERFFSVPTVWFGLFEIPHLPFIASLGEDARRSLGEAAIEAHEVLAYGAIGLIVLHVAAALKHHVIDRDSVLTHMLPWVKRRAPAGDGR